MRRLVAISFAVLITVSGALHAQGVWSKANPAKTPGPRNGHGMVYDIRRGVVVMFGGIGVKKPTEAQVDPRKDSQSHSSSVFR